MNLPMLNAHALGGWHGKTYLNTLEAFHAAYRKGFRNFEVDVACASDGVYCVTHGNRPVEHYSSKVFLANNRWNYTRILLRDVISLMQSHADITVMFDFHPCLYNLDNASEMRRFLAELPNGDVRSRCIVEAYSFINMEPVVADGKVKAILGWKHSHGMDIEECADWCVSNKVGCISVSFQYLLAHPSVVKGLKARKLTIYAWGIQSYDGLKDAYSLGIDVATVDFLVPGGRFKNFVFGRIIPKLWRVIHRCVDRMTWGGYINDRHLEPMSLSDVQSVALASMKVFHGYCERHGLRYFLAYGTLLGAVRHKGFIPWDDDIDVYMPRPDYEEFCRGFPNSLRYVVASPERNNAITTFSRLCERRSTYGVSKLKFTQSPVGVYIDVFPLDGAVDNIVAHDGYMKRINVLRRNLMTARLRPRYILKKGYCCSRRAMPWLLIKSQWYCIVSAKRWLRKARKMMAAYPYEKSMFVTNYSDNDGRDRLHMPKKWFQDRVLLPFADASFYCPIGYAEYLKNYYGDYMVLPDENNRRHRSHGRFLWRAQ